MHKPQLGLVAINARFTHSNPALYCLRNAAESVADIHLLEFNINGQTDAMLNDIMANDYDWLSFSCYIWNIGMVEILTKQVKKLRPETKIIWGGPEMTGAGEKWLNRCPAVDFIIEGEGETALPTLITAADWSKVPNLRWRKDGEIIKNPMAPPVDLAAQPMYYRPEDLPNLKNHIVYYESSRGCPHACSFCLSAREPVRYRPLEQIKRDLTALVEAGLPKIKFVDRSFNSEPERAAQLIDIMLELARPGLCFHLELEPEALDETTVSRLVTAPRGLFQAEIGVQSLHKPTLKAVGRKPLSEDAKAHIRRLLAADNMHIHLDLIAGLPYEGLDDFRQSFDGLFDIRPHYLQVGFLKLLPGSILEMRAEEFGLTCSDDPPYQVLKTPWLSYAELQEIKCAEIATDDYYNEGLFAETLATATSWLAANESPFDLFRAIGLADRSIFGNKGYKQKADILYDVLGKRFPEHKDAIRAALAADFASQQMLPPPPYSDLDEPVLQKEFNDELMALWPPLETIPRRKWSKYLHFFNADAASLHYLPGLYAACNLNPQGLFQKPEIRKLKNR